MKFNKRTALIDADIISYLAAYYSQTKFDDGEVWVDMEAAKAEVRRVTDEWTVDAGCEAALMVLSPDDRTNYRKLIWPEYKTNRKASAKPEHLSQVVAYIRSAFDCIEIPYLEGDDVMGILHTANPDSTVIVSTDKDMTTVPGTIYNPNRNYGHGPVEMAPAAAKQWLFTQVLTGDPTDGYKGVTKCGPVKANKILDEHYQCKLINERFVYSFDEEAAFEDVKQAYLDAGQTLDDFVTNYAMARILTHDLYDADNKRVAIPTAEFGVNRWLDLGAA